MEKDEQDYLMDVETRKQQMKWAREDWARAEREREDSSGLVLWLTFVMVGVILALLIR